MIRNAILLGPGGIGPVNLIPPADERIARKIIATAQAHGNWGPLRIFEELQSEVPRLTEANVHWVLHEYGLRDYT